MFFFSFIILALDHHTNLTHRQHSWWMSDELFTILFGKCDKWKHHSDEKKCLFLYYGSHLIRSQIKQLFSEMLLHCKLNPGTGLNLCWWTHIKEGFLLYVLGRPNGGRSRDHRLHLSQLDHTFTLLVLPALIISQLETHTHTHTHYYIEWFKLNACNVQALTWCLVLSKTNNRGFHGFNKAPLLKRIPSKLLIGGGITRTLKTWHDYIMKWFCSRARSTCSRSLCSGTGCKACWCWSAQQPVWTWRRPRTPEPSWSRTWLRSPAGRRPESAVGGTSWTTSARSWRTKAEGASSTALLLIVLLITWVDQTANPYDLTLLSSLGSVFCVVLILSHVSFHFSDVCPSSASSLWRSCSSFVMASGTVLSTLS